MISNDMAKVCHRNTYLTPDIEEMLGQYDLKIDHHTENIEDLENVLISKLKMCSIDLKNAHYKLCEQEREIKSLRLQLEKESCGDYKIPGVCDSELLYDSERNNVYLYTSSAKEDTEMTKLEMHKQIDNLIKETDTLKRKMNTKDIEIRQLRFRYKLLDDILKESKSGKNTKLFNVRYEKAFLQEEIPIIQEDNLKKDEELSKARLELKKAREWKVDMTDNCTLNVTLTEYEQEIRNLQEAIKHVTFLKDECKGALDKSLQNEAELGKTVLQLEDEKKEKEKLINKMKDRLNRYIGIIHDKEDTINNLSHSLQKQRQQLEARLEQSQQEIIKGKEQAYIAQDKMSKEIESLNDQMKNEKETILQSFESQVKQSIKINEDKQAKLNEIISQQSREIRHLQTELKSRSISHTMHIQLRYAVEELEQSKREADNEREKVNTTLKQMNAMFEKNKNLTLEITRKDIEIQELKKETEAKMIDVVNEANRQIVNLQEQLKQSFDETALLRGDNTKLRNFNQQKDIQISELKHETERNAKTLKEGESEMATTNYSLHRQLKAAEYELETCKQVILYEKSQSNIKMNALQSEIKYCKLKIKEKESELERQGVESRNQFELKEKEEIKLRGIMSRQSTNIRNLEKELEKRNVEITALEQVTQQNDQMKQDLNQSHENEVVVRRYIKELTSKLHEKEKHISELKKQLNTASKTLENKQSEFKNTPNSTENEMVSEKYQYNLEVDQVKEQHAANKMQINSTLKHRDREMENERHVNNRKETEQALDKSAETEGALRITINELQIIGHSLKMEQKKAEENLRQCHQEKEHEKEQLHLMKIQMCKEIEGLKKELTIREAALQEIHSQYEDSLKLHEETEVKLNGIITHKDKQIQKFSEDIKKKDLENKETECQIAELKRQLKEMTKASEQRETELGNMNSSLQLQHRTMETDMKKLTLDITHENELARTNKVLMEKMNAEIESLKLELMKKERHNKNLKDDNDRMKKEETKLKSIVNKQRDEIKNLKGEIEEKDIEVTHVDQSKELELFKKELNKLKEEELDLREMNQVLRNRNDEVENEVTVLKNQLDEITKTSNQTENELRNINHSMKQEVKNAEIQLEQQQLEISQEKQMTQTNQTRIEQLTKEIERLNLAMKEKDTTLQKYHERLKDANQRKEEAVLELNIIINKQNKEVQHLQEEIEKRDIKLASFDKVNKRSIQLQQAVNESHEKESDLSKTLNALQRGYQEKENLVSNLNSQINEMSEAFNKRETELKIINRSLQTQLNTSQGELEQLHKDVSHDKALVSTNQKHKVEMGKEIEKLKQDLEHKEITLQEHKVQYHTCIKIKKEEELKLNAIIEDQKCIIQYFKEDNKKKDMEVNSIEEIKKQKDQVQEALDALRVKEATLCNSIRVLEIKNKEKDEEVTELKKQLDDLRKTWNQKDNEFRNSNMSLKQQLNIKENELRRKEVEHSNLKALINTKDKHEITMAGEIERLKVEVKLKETLLQECNVKLKDAVKDKDGTESNLKEIIIKQNEDINNLKAKIEMQNDQNVTIDEIESRSKQIQQELNESHKKEAELGRTIGILQRRDKENEGQIRELKDQMNELSNTSKRKENQLQSMNSSLQTQLKNTESKLKELHLEKLHEKESISTYKKQMVGLNKEIESFKQEVKLKDARIHEYDIQCKDALKTKQEAEWKLKEIINKQNNEIQHLQKQIEKKDIEANDIAELKKHNEEAERAFNDLCEKEANLRKSNKDLHCRNREKEDEVRELKKQLSEMLKTVSQKENESQNIIHSIKQQLKNTEDIMRQQQLDISQEKKLMSTKDKAMEKMTEEIKSLKLQVKQKESTLQKCSEQYTDAVKLKQEAESKLNKIIHSHKTEIRHLQRDIERKDYEIARIEQINIRYEKVKNTLNESQEKEVTFRETIKALENKNQENENRIAELKRKLDKTSEESHKMEYELKETKHLLNGKNKSIEAEKDQYKQDIANAKQLSKAAQIKMSEMDTRINDLTNKLKKKEEDLQKGKENLSSIIDSQKDQIQHLEREVQKRERKMKSVQIEKDNELQEMKKHMVELENQMKHMLSKLRDTEAELDETKSRLSRVMGDRLTDNNPNITDLSDRNRPTKIAEKCAELYDNEWTDAFDVLEKLFRTEEAAIEALLLILQNAMHFCKTMAQRQIEFIEREMYFADENEKITVSSEIQKLIKDRRKTTATAVVGNLKKKYVAQLKQSRDKSMRAALDVEPYTSECIEICWFMLIQDPPVVFAPLPIKGSSFDTNLYKPYTKSGTHVDFAVWPALLLHERGPILAKGVAQGHGNK